MPSLDWLFVRLHALHSGRFFTNAVRAVRSAVAELRAKPENKVCADCAQRDPTWASANLGVFLCLNCSGVHRSLGVHITQVRSITMDAWFPDQIKTMQTVGNARARAYWEANVPAGHFIPDENASRGEMEVWIKAKYEQRRFVASQPPSQLTPNPVPRQKSGGGGGAPAVGPPAAKSAGGASAKEKRAAAKAQLAARRAAQRAALDERPPPGGAGGTDIFGVASVGNTLVATSSAGSAGTGEGAAAVDDGLGNAQQVELRVDPADGNHYSVQDFIDAYGGTAEWDAAAPPAVADSVDFTFSAPQVLPAPEPAQATSRPVMSGNSIYGDSSAGEPVNDGQGFVAPSHDAAPASFVPPVAGAGDSEQQAPAVFSFMANAGVAPPAPSPAPGPSISAPQPGGAAPAEMGGGFSFQQATNTAQQPPPYAAADPFAGMATAPPLNLTGTEQGGLPQAQPVFGQQQSQQPAAVAASMAPAPARETGATQTLSRGQQARAAAAARRAARNQPAHQQMPFANPTLAPAPPPAPSPTPDMFGLMGGTNGAAGNGVAQSAFGTPASGASGTAAPGAAAAQVRMAAAQAEMERYQASMGINAADPGSGDFGAPSGGLSAFGQRGMGMLGKAKQAAAAAAAAAETALAERQAALRSTQQPESAGGSSWGAGADGRRGSRDGAMAAVGGLFNRAADAAGAATTAVVGAASAARRGSTGDPASTFGTPSPAGFGGGFAAPGAAHAPAPAPQVDLLSMNWGGK